MEREVCKAVAAAAAAAVAAVGGGGPALLACRLPALDGPAGAPTVWAWRAASAGPPAVRAGAAAQPLPAEAGRQARRPRRSIVAGQSTSWHSRAACTSRAAEWRGQHTQRSSAQRSARFQRLSPTVPQLSNALTGTGRVWCLTARPVGGFRCKRFVSRGGRSRGRGDGGRMKALEGRAWEGGRRGRRVGREVHFLVAKTARGAVKRGKDVLGDAAAGRTARHALVRRRRPPLCVAKAWAAGPLCVARAWAAGLRGGSASAGSHGEQGIAGVDGRQEALQGGGAGRARRCLLQHRALAPPLLLPPLLPLLRVPARMGRAGGRASTRV